MLLWGGETQGMACIGDRLVHRSLGSDRTFCKSVRVYIKSWGKKPKTLGACQTFCSKALGISWDAGLFFVPSCPHRCWLCFCFVPLYPCSAASETGCQAPHLPHFNLPSSWLRLGAFSISPLPFLVSLGALSPLPLQLSVRSLRGEGEGGQH